MIAVRILIKQSADLSHNFLDTLLFISDLLLQIAGLSSTLGGFAYAAAYLVYLVKKSHIL